MPAFAGLSVIRFLRSGQRITRSTGRLLLAATSIPVVSYLLIVFCVAPSAYAQSSYPVARAMVIARFVTVIAAAVLGAEIGRAAALSISSAGQTRALTWLACLFIVLTYIYPIQAAPGVLAEIPRYRRWAAFWDARDLEIRRARGRGQSDLLVVRIDHIIPSVAELSPDPGYWYNNCAERYYDAGSISASLPGWDD